MKIKKGSALEGIKVLDLGRVIAAPFSAAMLADLGAEVIKIEVPVYGDNARDNMPKKDGVSSYYVNFNRSKKGITLDLKKGKDVFLKMVKEADIVVENFRPGVMEKLGIGYDELVKVNPSLIYASISGFGQYGPYAERAGYDPIAQAMSGIMSVTGWPDTPPTRCGASVVDILAGLNATVGILSALQYRNRTGKGQMIDISLQDVSIVGLSSVNQVFLTDRQVPYKRGNGYAAGAPGGSYKCKDGYVILMALGEPAWVKFCKTIGKEELLKMDKFKENGLRAKNSAELDHIIEAWTLTMNVNEVVELLLNTGLPAGPILDIEQVYNNEHVKQREMFTTVNHPEVGDMEITNQGIKMSETSPFVRGCAPLLGQHNREIYNEFGFSDDEIDLLIKENII